MSTLASHDAPTKKNCTRAKCGKNTATQMEKVEKCKIFFRFHADGCRQVQCVQ